MAELWESEIEWKPEHDLVYETLERWITELDERIALCKAL